MENTRLASRLIRAGVVVMAYDAAVALALLVFGERVAPQWALPSLLVTFVLFPVAYFSVVRPFSKAAGPWVNFTSIFWMLRHIPHWAKACWAATLTATFFMEAEQSGGPRDAPLDAPTALLFTLIGFYFTLSSTLLAWAKVREQQSITARQAQG